MFIKNLKITSAALLFFVFIAANSIVFTQGMMGSFYQTYTSSSTLEEEAKGKQVWDQLQSKQADCNSLSDTDFDVLGDYYMGQMVGNSHEAMNNMMTQMMGDAGEKQMHVVMGKRLSGCDPSAVAPIQGSGFFPMMGMLGMMGGNCSNYLRGGVGNMMGNYGYGNIMGWAGFGIGWIWMLLWWAFVILAIVVAVRWLLGKQNGIKRNDGSNPVAILKERYAKGEISKEQFEQMRKDIVA